MTRKRTLALTLSLLAFSPGCKNAYSLAQEVDRTWFRFTGNALLSEPRKVSLQEIHLDSSALVGAELLLEGEVVEVGPAKTYLVIADEGSRVLVSLTQLDLTANEIDWKARRVRLLGSLDAARNGLPLVTARAAILVSKANGTGAG